MRLAFFIIAMFFCGASFGCFEVMEINTGELLEVCVDIDDEFEEGSIVPVPRRDGTEQEAVVALIEDDQHVTLSIMGRNERLVVTPF